MTMELQQCFEFNIFRRIWGPPISLVPLGGRVILPKWTRLSWIKDEVVRQWLKIWIVSARTGSSKVGIAVFVKCLTVYNAM